VNKNPVLLLGLFDTAIMTARCFKGKGIPVYGMDYAINNAGFHSNLINAQQIPVPLGNELKCVEYIIQWSGAFSNKPVLIPTSDLFVNLIKKYGELFGEHFLFLIPNYRRIKQILERSRQYTAARNAGLIVPNFIVGPIRSESVTDLPLSFPVAVKPENVNEWKIHFKNKGFIASNVTHLAQIINEVNYKSVEYLIQEIISGDNTQNYEVNSLYLPDGRLFQHTIRKLRQYPDGFGTATCIEHHSFPELEEYATVLLKKLELIGFSNIEFKYNNTDGKYYYIETNTRAWLQVNFSANLGINFPELYYRYLTGRDLPPRIEIKDKGKWVDFMPDLLFWTKYRKKYNYSLWGFIRSWFPLISCGLFSLTDPMPFIISIKNMQVIGKFLKKKCGRYDN
jgi:predicted ATP-grasp superfamily ATP-dependent carboligase